MAPSAFWPLRPREANWLAAPVTVKTAYGEPSLTVTLLTLRAGIVVSTVMVTVLLASEPSAFWLPAASENLASATLTTPLAVLPAVGVNVAV